MTRESQSTLARLYAALTGVLGLVVLIWLFEQAHAIDLATLLAFALFAVIMSYFCVPIGAAGVYVGLDGAVLLSATLAGGPALGGWASFAAGLVAGIASADRGPSPRWADRAAQALLNGGRNVLASFLAWGAYQGMNGGSQGAIGSTETPALLLLCLVFALVRYMWPGPYWVLHARARGLQPGTLLTLTGFALELVPLPSALLTAAIFVRLGWAYFLLLALVYVGLGAMMRQMLAQIIAQQQEVEALALRVQICDAIGEVPHEIPALSMLAYQLCQQVVPQSRFELGLYDPLCTQVTIQVSALGETRLPPMRMPVPPMWEWLSKQSDLQQYYGTEMLAQLPFALPPLEKDCLPQKALFVPLVPDADTTETQDSPPDPIGGIVIQSAAAEPFSKRQLSHIAEIADRIGGLLAQCSDREKPPRPEPG